ncbi:MAG: PepSY domain-containing protein [Sutterella sp.]
MKKTALAALIAATLSLASVSFAQTPAEAPAPAAQTSSLQAEAQSAVRLTDAVAEAEKAYSAKAVRANLRQTAKYGTVWCIRLIRDDGTRVKAYIDANTGRAVAADVLGIAPEGRRGSGCQASAGPRHGHGHGFAGPRGMHRPDCPAAPHQPRPCMNGCR